MVLKFLFPQKQMSIERCTDGCAAASFNTAGLERGQVLRCGNTMDGKPPACSNATFRAWAMRQNFVEGRSPEAVSWPIAAFPELAGAPPGWLQQGCWEDDVTSNGGMHLLPRAPNVTIPSGEMTVEKCVAACTNFPGYNTSAGLTAGDECWCGDYSVTPSVPAPCGTRCTGNGREICGGDSSMAIYSNPVTALQQYFTFFGNWSLQGCFVDEAWLTGGPHLLPTKTPIIPD
ncbi:hypothetical protein DFH09DRAFT_332631 [Mycena vulgaris]|nr:hypothetical protein DFH09DRAFT_332631 [Mycena vulgaris]